MTGRAWDRERRNNRLATDNPESFLCFGRAQQAQPRGSCLAGPWPLLCSLYPRGFTSEQRWSPALLPPWQCTFQNLNSLKQRSDGCLGVCLPFFLSSSSKGLIFCSPVIKAFISVITTFEQCKQDHTVRQWFVYFFVLVFQVNANTSLRFGL